MRPSRAWTPSWKRAWSLSTRPLRCSRPSPASASALRRCWSLQIGADLSRFKSAESDGRRPEWPDTARQPLAAAHAS
jgi:hypothetical protein